MALLSREDRILRQKTRAQRGYLGRNASLRGWAGEKVTLIEEMGREERSRWRGCSDFLIVRIDSDSKRGA